MRLIGADALIAYIKKRIRNEMVIAWLCRIISEVPTIEAEPVRHGRWKPWSPKILGMEYSYDTMECNLCGKTLHNARLFANYYPNCGAKMEGGSHEV